MDHLNENVLGTYALDPALLRNRKSVESHLRVCESCSATFEEIRRFDEALADPDSWTAIEDERFGELCRFEQTVAEEEAEAERLLEDFNDAPAARFVWADLPANPAYHTGGVVRALSKRANAMHDRDPRYSLALAEAAVAIADELSDDRYPRAAVREWRGEAYKEQAYALLCIGRFHEALASVDIAERQYEELAHGGIGKVKVLYARALILLEQDELEAACDLADRSANDALHLGDVDLYMAARHLVGAIHLQKCELTSAIGIFGPLLQYGKEIEEPIWIARESSVLGHCHLEAGRLSDARAYLHAALREFTKLGMKAEVTRTEWLIARLVFAEGAQFDGMQRLRRCIEALGRLHMFTDAALAAVHLAEMLSITGRTREIPHVLDGVVQTFTRAGKLTGALAALAYLKQTAVHGRLTTAISSHVSDFLRRADRQPELLFAPPPEPPL